MFPMRSRMVPLTADELVRKAGIRAHPVALHRALRACAALGIVTEDSVGRFGPTRLSALLTRDTPGTLKRFVEYSGGLLWKIWTGLPEGLATGASQARAQLGLDFFDYLAANPQALEEFGETLKAHSAVANKGVMERYDFAGIRHARRRRRRATGRSPSPCSRSFPTFAASCSTCPRSSTPRRRSSPSRTSPSRGASPTSPGDMFKDVPPADAYVLKLILHDWDDASCAKILA